MEALSGHRMRETCFIELVSMNTTVSLLYSCLEAMASNLLAMASNLVEFVQWTLFYEQ